MQVFSLSYTTFIDAVAVNVARPRYFVYKTIGYEIVSLAGTSVAEMDAGRSIGPRLTCKRSNSNEKVNYRRGDCAGL